MEKLYIVKKESQKEFFGCACPLLLTGEDVKNYVKNSRETVQIFECKFEEIISIDGWADND